MIHSPRDPDYSFLGIPVPVHYATALVALLAVPHRHASRSGDGYGRCGYDLRGTRDDVCPECGVDQRQIRVSDDARRSQARRVLIWLGAAIAGGGTQIMFFRWLMNGGFRWLMNNHG